MIEKYFNTFYLCSYAISDPVYSKFCCININQIKFSKSNGKSITHIKPMAIKE